MNPPPARTPRKGAGAGAGAEAEAEGGGVGGWSSGCADMHHRHPMQPPREYNFSYL